MLHTNGVSVSRPLKWQPSVLVFWDGLGLCKQGPFVDYARSDLIFSLKVTVLLYVHQRVNHNQIGLPPVEEDIGPGLPQGEKQRQKILQRKSSVCSRPRASLAVCDHGLALAFAHMLGMADDESWPLLVAQLAASQKAKPCRTLKESRTTDRQTDWALMRRRPSKRPWKRWNGPWRRWTIRRRRSSATLKRFNWDCKPCWKKRPKAATAVKGWCWQLWHPLSHTWMMVLEYKYARAHECLPTFLQVWLIGCCLLILSRVATDEEVRL